MSIQDLTEEERSTIKQCLDAVASGEMIRDDWEFSTLFGIQFSELCAVADAWPNVDESDESTIAAIIGAMNHLVGYPHRNEARWPTYISSPPSEVLRVLSRFLGEQTAGNHENTPHA